MQLPHTSRSPRIRVAVFADHFRANKSWSMTTLKVSTKNIKQTKNPSPHRWSLGRCHFSILLRSIGTNERLLRSITTIVEIQPEQLNQRAVTILNRVTNKLT